MSGYLLTLQKSTMLRLVVLHLILLSFSLVDALLPLGIGRLHCDPPPDLSPSNEPPVSVDASRQGDLLPHAGAHGLGEADLGQVGLDGDHATASGQGADVDHQHLVLGQLGHLGGLLVALHAHAQKAAEQVVGDLKESEKKILTSSHINFYFSRKYQKRMAVIFPTHKI